MYYIGSSNGIGTAFAQLNQYGNRELFMVKIGQQQYGMK